MASTSELPVVAVIGSLNVDLVTRTNRIPDGGETLTSSSFDIGFGGKGANQAVACARLSRPRPHSVRSLTESPVVEVRMVGAVGDDEFAASFLDSLKNDGLNVASVQTLKGYKTGVAVILVEEQTGENRILLSPGANHALPKTGLVDADIKVAVFQLEVPLDVVTQAMKDTKAIGGQVILNPAPAIPLPEETYQYVDHLIVNETEAAILSGRNVADVDVRQPSKLASIFHFFLSKGLQIVIITLGSQGVVFQTQAMFKEGTEHKHVEGKKVSVVDTTAAGDTFVGAYTIAVTTKKFGEGQASFEQTIQHANAAASLTVQRKGAQSSIPWSDEVQ